MIDFEVGDIVRAKTTITRVDGKEILHQGQLATVCQIFQRNKNSPQIVNLKISKDHLEIRDIVCLDNNCPIEFVKR